MKGMLDCLILLFSGCVALPGTRIDARIERCAFKAALSSVSLSSPSLDAYIDEVEIRAIDSWQQIDSVCNAKWWGCHVSGCYYYPDEIIYVGREYHANQSDRIVINDITETIIHELCHGVRNQISDFDMHHLDPIWWAAIDPINSIQAIANSSVLGCRK